MRAGARLIVALALAGFAADPALAPAWAQTRGDQVQSKPTTTTAPSRTQPSSTPTRTAPTSLPVDPGGLSGLPAGSPTRAGPDYGPGGTTTTRPRRSTATPPDAQPADDIPYVDPPAAPGYETATDAPMRTAGGKPPPATPTSPATPTPPAAPAPSAQASTAPAPPSPPAAPTPPPGANNVSVIDAAGPSSEWNPSLLIVLIGLIAMLAAAGLGLKHLLTPRLSFRVRMDNGVQSAPARKEALG